MATLTLHSPDEQVFRGYLPYYVLKLLAVLVVGGGATAIAIVQQTATPLLAIPCVLAYGLWAVCCYATERVIVRGYSIVIRRGAFGMVQDDVPLIGMRLETPQSLMGRVCGYGTVRVVVGTDCYEMHSVASIQALRQAVNARQRSAFDGQRWIGQI